MSEQITVTKVCTEEELIRFADFLASIVSEARADDWACSDCLREDDFWIFSAEMDD